MEATTTAFQLLQLPDACLLAVRQRLVDSADWGQFNRRSLFTFTASALVALADRFSWAPAAATVACCRPAALSP
jgi:hypothetical protein